MRLYLKGTLSTNWRQIIRFDRVNMCPIIDGSDRRMKLFNHYRQLAFEMFPTLPRKCPVLAKEYRADDITVMSPYIVEILKDNNKFITLSLSEFPPNGIYRCVVKVYSDKDPIGMTYWYHAEVNVRLNEETY